jgi:EAL domain-containing protein (putative c-di-GMP-specific phosphodiesterase class I)
MLEVTEQAFARNLRPAEPAVSLLADAGMDVAVLDTSRASRDLVSALTTMALTLGLRVVAEGIETAEQLALLHVMGCTLGQGYLLSRAAPIGDAEVLREQAPWERTWAEDAVG